MYKTSILIFLIFTIGVSIIRCAEVSNRIRSTNRRAFDSNNFEEEDLNEVPASANPRMSATRRRPISRPRPEPTDEFEESLDNPIVPTSRTPATRRRGGNVAENTPATTFAPVAMVTTMNANAQQFLGSIVPNFQGFVNPLGAGAAFPVNQGGSGGAGNAFAQFGENARGQVSGGNGGMGGNLQVAGDGRVGGVAVGGRGGAGSAVATFGRGSSGVVSGGNGGSGGSIQSSGGGGVRGGDGGAGSAQATFEG